MENIRIIKRNFFLLIIFILVLIFLISLSLGNYLHYLRNYERLSKVKDYTSLTVSYTKQKRSNLQYQFTYNGYNYYYLGIDQLFVSYLSSSMTLKDVLTNKIFTLDNILTNSTYEKVDDLIYYTYMVNDVEKSYYVLIKDNNIIISNTLLDDFQLL